MEYRNPSSDEMRLIDFLIKKAKGLNAPNDLCLTLKVADMEDGGMGGLRLFPEGIEVPYAIFGKQASACQFTDSDGVEVIASLYLDKNGTLYELDMWKTNFDKLINIPENSNFKECC